MTVNLRALLEEVIEKEASDLHITAGECPKLRIDGDIVNSSFPEPLSPKETLQLAYSVLTENQKKRFETEDELDFSFGIANLSRFRGNVYKQRGCVSMAIRQIPYAIRTFQELNLPPIVETLAEKPRGLVLITGPTGSGKSTTLASMIEHINANRTCHIMTIEDPIEFLIRDRRSIVNQREIGVDTQSFSNALRAALRQDPDVILVGEMRDFETIETALTAAETGHLVMSTLHTLDATETINRIISVFPPYQQKQIRLQLGSILRAVVSQRLVPRSDGKGRVPALEVLVTTARVRECIADKDRTKEIHDAIAKGFTTYGMQTFDQSLMHLVKKGLVTYEESLKHVSNPDDFALRFRGIASTSDGNWESFEGSKEAQEKEEVPAGEGASAAGSADDDFIQKF